MYRVKKPVEKVSDVFSHCVEGIGDLPLKMRLQSCLKEVISAEIEFADKISSHELFLIPVLKANKHNKATPFIGGQVTIDEMKDVYRKYFSVQGTNGRSLYNQLLASSKGGICPLCGLKSAKTIDHYLPQAYYPRLCVTPINLVPACWDCNYGKRSGRPESASQETMHPYFDDIENDQWLAAKVVRSLPITIDFFVNVPITWNALLGDRVRHHFDKFELKREYGVQAATELNSISHWLKGSSQIGGPAAVESDLRRLARSRSVSNLNSWAAVMYTALADDKWFLDTGVKLLESK